MQPFINPYAQMSGCPDIGSKPSSCSSKNGKHGYRTTSTDQQKPVVHRRQINQEANSDKCRAIKEKQSSVVSELANIPNGPNVSVGQKIGEGERSKSICGCPDQPIR